MAVNLEKLFPREYVRNDGVTLNIYQAAIGDVGCVVWDAALVLAKYLESADFLHGRLLQDKTVLELGAGTGCLGIVAATFGAKVCITDLESCLPLMQMNIGENHEQITGKIEAQILDWNSHDTLTSRPDYILISDCIYYSESVKPLVDTINRLCEPHTIVLCSYEERTSGNKPELQRHFYELIEATFNVQEIPQNHQDDFYHSSDIHIMKFTKKS
ncbi:VCPKMT [Acanthosepion pharaonis]|uniref:VCPKMT n=1 Tax=Acanthosepion pharaonis TaxID=158019 RepID=A0A812CCI8_ACAPH|nr:VCPKMT [Sepia pharaonis]